MTALVELKPAIYIVCHKRGIDTIYITVYTFHMKGG